MSGRVPKAYYVLAGRTLTFLEKWADDPSVGENEFAVWMLMNVSHGKLGGWLLFRGGNTAQKEAYVEFHVPAHIAAKHGVKRKVAIHVRASGFVSMAVFKRLTVIASAKRQGGCSKAHQLYNDLLGYCGDVGFQAGKVTRKHHATVMKSSECRIFRQVAERAERERLSKGSASPSMIKELGKLYLTLPDGDVPFPEEIGVGDIIGCLPFPLDISGIPFKKRMLGPFADVLCSAGERYKLLRRVGLDPDQWFDRDEPTTNQMRAMIELRKGALDAARFHPDSSIEDVVGVIWRENPVPKVGSFEDFMGTAWGRRFVETIPHSKRLPAAELVSDNIEEIADGIEALEDELGDDAEPPRASAKHLGTMISELVVKDWLKKAEGYYLQSLISGRLTVASALEDKVLRQMIIDDEGEPEGESFYDREQCMNERFNRLRKFTMLKLKTYLGSEVGERTATAAFDSLCDED